MAKSENVKINGRDFTRAEIVETGEKQIEKGRKTRKIGGIVLIVFAAMALIGAPVAKVQGSISGIGEMIGAMVGSIVIAGLGVLLIFKAKSYPNKCDAYDIGLKYLNKHVSNPAHVVVKRELIDEKNITKHNKVYLVKIYEVTYEDGHTERVVEEHPQ